MAEAAPIDFRTVARPLPALEAQHRRRRRLPHHGRERGWRAFRPGYKLKLNSYDLGVDIELADAVQRLRFEHPEVGAVVIRSQRDRIFCSGANINMLGLSARTTTR